MGSINPYGKRSDEMLKISVNWKKLEREYKITRDMIEQWGRLTEDIRKRTPQLSTIEQNVLLYVLHELIKQPPSEQPPSLKINYREVANECGWEITLQTARNKVRHLVAKGMLQMDGNIIRWTPGFGPDSISFLWGSESTWPASGSG